MRRFAWLLVLVAGRAEANGRPPATSTLHWQQGHDQNIVAGLTFGQVISHDNGLTWHWMCEAAIGYGGIYDPSYAYTSTGAIFATTFSGLVVNRDGCTFTATPPGSLFMGTIALGPDAAFYYAASDSGTMDSHACKS